MTMGSTLTYTRPLPGYRGRSCAAVVHALKVELLLENPRGIELHFEDKGFVPFQVPALWAEIQKAEAGCYFVWDRYGDKSCMAAAEFEASFTLIEETP